MSTLAEIETTADALPPEPKQKLLLFLAVRGDFASLLGGSFTACWC